MNRLKTFNLIAFILVFSIGVKHVEAQQNTLADKGLSAKQKSIISISALTAKGNLQALKPALNTGLEAGLTINEIKEILVHLYAYCGFPRSIRGLQTFMEVVNERKAKGVVDVVGAGASPILNDASKYERGKKILAELTRTSSDRISGYSAFAPTIDTFLKEHLFADIFERDVLTYAQRELVTISVISAIGDADPMLQGHLSISLNVGITPKQLKEFVTIINASVGEKEAKSANNVLDLVLNSK